jgi:hypothetical protein
MVPVAPSAHALTAHLSCWQQRNWSLANLVRLARRPPGAFARAGPETPMTGFCTHRYWLEHRGVVLAPATRGPDSLAPQLTGIGATTSPAPGHLLNTPKHSDRKISSIKYSSSVADRTHGEPPSSGSRSVPNVFANRDNGFCFEKFLNLGGVRISCTGSAARCLCVLRGRSGNGAQPIIRVTPFWMELPQAPSLAKSLRVGSKRLDTVLEYPTEIPQAPDSRRTGRSAGRLT